MPLDRNEIILIGGVGQTPTLSYSQAGNAILTLSVGTKYKNRDGEERTEWHRVKAFGKLAEAYASLKQGDSVLVTGRMAYGKYTGKDGIDRYSADIIAADLGLMQRPDLTAPARQSAPQKERAPKSAPPVAGTAFDDDIPF